MKMDHHSVLNAVSRAIMLCDTDPAEAQEGLYALGDYLKHYFAAAARTETAPTVEDTEQIESDLAVLKAFLTKRYQR